MKSSQYVVLAPIFAFLYYFYYLPIFQISKRALGYNFQSWKEELTHPLVLPFTIFTFQQALLTVFASLFVGLPAGYLLARKQPYFTSFIRSAITVPFLFPPIAILVGFVVFFERKGFLASFLNSIGISYSFSPFSFWGIVLAHTIYNIAVIARITEGALLSEPVEYHDIAKTLGASSWFRFRTITLPHIRPSLEAAILLVFLYSFNSFAIVLVLGQVKLQTIEVMIYQQFKIRLNFQRAIILAFYQLFINFLVILLYTKRRIKKPIYQETFSTFKSSNGSMRSTIFLSFILLIQWFPIIGLFSSTIKKTRAANTSAFDEVFSGSYDQLLGTSSIRVLLNSLIFGIMVSLITILFGLLLVLSSMISENDNRIEQFTLPIFLLPMGTSAITLSFAILLSHGGNKWYNEYVWVVILAAHIIATLPFVSRVIFASWNSVPKDLIIMSSTLGANHLFTFRKVVFPIMKSAFGIAILFSFAISIGEFGATFFLVRGEWITLSVAIERLFGSRSALLPNIYASLLILVTLIIFIIMEKFGHLELKL